MSLCKAIEAKDLKEIDRLVMSGVNVNAKGRGNMTPLLWAFPMGEEVFEKMLALGSRSQRQAYSKSVAVSSLRQLFRDGRLREPSIY